MPRRTMEEARALLESSVKTDDVSLIEMEGTVSGIMLGLMLVSGEMAMVVPLTPNAARVLSEGLANAAAIIESDRTAREGQ